MNHSHDTRLNRLLEEWADQSVASSEDLTALQQRVVEQLETNTTAVADFPLPTTSTQQWVTVFLATAATLLVGLGIWQYDLLQQRDQRQLASTEMFDSPQAFEAYWSQQLHRQEQLLTESREVFGQGVTWVTETKQSCDVGLLPADLANQLPNEYIVVQLWLVARNQQSGQSEVRTISVLAGRDEVVELPAGAGGGHLVLWAHPVDKALISIDLRYRPASVAGVQIENSHLQRVGQVTNIHSFEQDGIEYQLYQAADLIHHKLG